MRQAFQPNSIKGIKYILQNYRRAEPQFENPAALKTKRGGPNQTGQSQTIHLGIPRALSSYKPLMRRIQTYKTVNKVSLSHKVEEEGN
ncbi:hypothetical protein CEXT_33551 [Caerostris extrusa]|uniref:Uncharacterized protein n=1 Tax=Caerostris extrusa TaxID=172846 RepID=A0AAV4PS61_CAEEX|nr:hypothetical protein CEXT_33551 [Caerostris extrusa]